MWPKIGSFLAAYGEIAIGLFIGALAHFGLHMNKESNMSIKAIIAYLLQLSFVGLLATVIVLLLAIKTPEIKVFVAALMAIAGNDAVLYAREKYKPMIDRALGKPDE